MALPAHCCKADELLDGWVGSGPKDAVGSESLPVSGYLVPRERAADNGLLHHVFDLQTHGRVFVCLLVTQRTLVKGLAHVCGLSGARCVPVSW